MTRNKVKSKVYDCKTFGGRNNTDGRFSSFATDRRKVTKLHVLRCDRFHAVDRGAILVTVDTILFFSILSMTFFCLLSRLLVKYDFVFGTSYCSLSVVNKVRSIYYICITTYIVMVNGKKSMNKNEGKKSKF